jgi:hypothetical protein
VQIILRQSKQHSLLGRKPLTGITTKRTIQKSFGSQWVFFLNIQLVLLLINFVISVLHPQHKLEYFEKAGWKDTWVKRAEEIVRKEFDRSYKYSDDLNGILADPEMTVRNPFYFLTGKTNL